MERHQKRNVRRGRRDNEERAIEVPNRRNEETNVSPPKSGSRSGSSHSKTMNIFGEDVEEASINVTDISEIIDIRFGDPSDGQYDCSKINWEYTPDRRGIFVSQ